MSTPLRSPMATPLASEVSVRETDGRVDNDEG